jgi:DNA-binding MarR family transcriptional regulator
MEVVAVSQKSEPSAVSSPPLDNQGRSRKFSVEHVWTQKLGRKFTPISTFFLANLHRLGPPGGKGLTPTEAMVICQIFTFKWDGRAPKPALRTVATRLGLSVRTVRDTVKRLEELKLVERELSAEGGANRYHFQGLFARLEALMDADADATDEAENAAEGGA